MQKVRNIHVVQCPFSCFKQNAVNDYEVLDPSQLVFDVGVSSLCTDITTTDDAVYKGNESLTLTLASEDENVDVSGSTTTLLIIDNDGKYNLANCVLSATKSLLSACCFTFYRGCS